MSRKPQEPRDEALRELLRRGDPVGDGREPTPEEVALMRREVLDATRTRSGAALLHWWRPAAAVAAMVVMALAAWLVLRDADSTTPIPHETRETAAATGPGPETVEAAPAEPQPTHDSMTDDAHETEQVRIAAAGTAPPGTEVSATTTEDRSARTIRFTTRNGTRIIWTLDPDFEI
jgi:hypothetical protein